MCHRSPEDHIESDVVFGYGLRGYVELGPEIVRTPVFTFMPKLYVPPRWKIPLNEEHDCRQFAHYSGIGSRIFRFGKKGYLGEAMFQSIRISSVFAAINYKPMGTSIYTRLTEIVRASFSGSDR